MIEDALTENIIRCAYEVHSSLGSGFLEKIYENSLVIELKSQGLTVKQQEPIAVKYKENDVGKYFTDLIVENEVIIEMKASKNIDEKHKAQLIHYLTATGKTRGLIFNFGSGTLGIKRIVNKYLE